MDHPDPSPFVTPLLVGLFWFLPLPLTWFAFETDPLFVGIFVVPTVAAIVVSLAVWKYGWAPRSFFRDAIFGAVISGVSFGALHRGWVYELIALSVITAASTTFGRGRARVDPTP